MLPSFGKFYDQTGICYANIFNIYLAAGISWKTNYFDNLFPLLENIDLLIKNIVVFLHANLIQQTCKNTFFVHKLHDWNSLNET